MQLRGCDIRLGKRQGPVLYHHMLAWEPSGALPRSLWVSGEILVDDHAVLLPSDIEVGAHTLQVGIYNPATGGRLAVSSSGDVSDGALLLTRIEITP